MALHPFVKIVLLILRKSGTEIIEKKKDEYSRKRYVANRENILEQSRNFYRHNREKKAKYSRKRFEANRENILAHCRNFYRNNREKKIEYTKGWIQKNQERYKESLKKCRGKAIKELKNSYVKNILFKRGFSPELLQQQPEIMEATKLLIKIKRYVREQKNN